MMNALDTSPGPEAANDVRAPLFGAADWLCLAAAPTFAIMAALTAIPGGPPDLLCAAAREASPLSGMVPMYVLMSAFHLAPWLKLIARSRSPGGETARAIAPVTRRLAFALPFPSRKRRPHV
jgi:hypothetical protein